MLGSETPDASAKSVTFLFESTPPLLGPQPSYLRTTKGHFRAGERNGNSPRLSCPIKEAIHLTPKMQVVPNSKGRKIGSKNQGNRISRQAVLAISLVEPVPGDGASAELQTRLSSP